MRKLLSFLLIFNLAHATAPTGYKNETATAKTYAQDLVFPNNQLTKQAGLDSRIETGNTNLLTNPSFEHSTVTTGWTITNATATADITNQVEGKKALSLALTGALSVIQDSTINAANLVGLQGNASIKIKTSDVDGLKVCARNAGVTSTSLCVNIPKDGLWKEINIPYILTATSNGIAITSTGTTGTVKLDDAFVGTSAPFQNVARESLVSAKITTAGVVSDETEDFINGNCAVTGTSTYTCTFNTSFFKSAPTCVATPNAGAGTARYLRAVVNSTTSMAFETLNSAATAATADIMVQCQRTGADLSGNFKIMSQASQDVAYQPCTFSTLAWQGFGTVTNNLLCARKGQDLLIKGKWTAGTTAASLGQIPLPTNFGSLTIASNISSNQVLGSAWRNAGAAAVYYNLLASPSTSYISVSNSLINGTNSPVSPVNGSSIVNSSEVQDIPEVKIPIQGWQDYGVIVGSFAEVTTSPGLNNNVLFSGQISNTAVLSNQKGGTISSCTFSSTGVLNCTVPSGKLSSSPNCTVACNEGNSASQFQCYFNPTSTTSTNIQFITTISAGSTLSNRGVSYICHGEKP